MTMNWDNQRFKDLLDNNEMAITSMKVLQSYVSSLSKSHQALRFQYMYLIHPQEIKGSLAAIRLMCT
jgi:hypothetical protein